MAFQKALFISLGLASTFALAACGTKDDNNTGMGGTAGTGAAGAVGTGGTSGGGTPSTGGTSAAGAGAGAAGAATADCSTVNFASYVPNAAAVSFTTDLLPMFGQACTASDCHNQHDHNAMLNLGNKCDFDPNAKWKCTFPTMSSDPSDFTKSAPDDPATAMLIYQDLMKPAVTVTGGTPMARVKPGDPANSFLMLKLADQQNSKMLACTNFDPSHDPEQPPLPCGSFMPLTGTKYCQGTTRPRFDAIAQWIANGAPMN
jgi:hypothetical protein